MTMPRAPIFTPQSVELMYDEFLLEGRIARQLPQYLGPLTFEMKQEVVEECYRRIGLPAWWLPIDEDDYPERNFRDDTLH
jgi:hypothetical protein